ncbi:MAG: DUF4173 domain-containing protein, partial [Verrucomicrobia bacterium]|nr:DUF4173 domain-containing protein [Cytophagales bacterium]
VCLVWQHSMVAWLATLLSFLFIVGFSILPQSSLPVAGVQAFYTLLISALSKITHSFFPKDSTLETKPHKTNGLRIAVIPVLVTLVFVFLYSQSNPIFGNFISKLNFNSITAGWVFFTLGSGLLLTGIFFPEKSEVLQNFDPLHPDNLLRKKTSLHGRIVRILGLKSEFQIGKLLFGLLNLLLLLVNVLDLVYLFVLKTLPEGVQEKEFLHQSVNSLIFSVLLAIAIILYFFRGNLNFFRRNELLKIFVYLWIFQNLGLVLITCYKNTSYIENFGLTHKRIGVYVYLLLTCIGLCVTFLKVYAVKSNWFLIRANFSLSYGVLLLASFFSWDEIITNYNYRHYQKPSHEWLIDYAISLSDRNLPQLHQMLADNSLNLSATQRNAIFSKKQLFLEKQKILFLEKQKSLVWQSWNWSDTHILSTLTQDK